MVKFSKMVRECDLLFPLIDNIPNDSGLLLKMALLAIKFLSVYLVETPES